LDEEDYDKILIIGDMNARIGDFNPPQTDPEDFTQRKSKDKLSNKRGKSLINFMNQSGWNVLNGYTNSDREGEFTFTNANGSSVIDLAICSSLCNEAISDFEVLSSHLSSHSPILIKLNQQLNLDHPSNHKKEFLTRIKFNPSIAQDFRTEISKELQLDKNETWSWPHLKKAALTSARKLEILKKVPVNQNFKIQSAPWFDEELEMARADIRTTIKALRRHHDQKTTKELQTLYHTQRRMYFNMRTQKKKIHHDNLLSSITCANNPTDFWDAINKFRQKKHMTSNDIPKIVWRSHFTNLFSNKDTRDPFMGQGSDNSPLDIPITRDEIITAIKKSGCRKAPGLDGLPNEVFKNLPANEIDNLLTLFNQMLDSGEVPDDWSKVLIQPIYKKGDKEQPSNYRPISLISTGLKILTSILAARLLDWSKENKKISEFQAGFKKGIGTMEQIFSLNTLIQSKLMSPGGKLFVTFVDLKCAFDSPSHAKLWEEMTKIGMGRKILNLLRNLYTNANGVIKTSHGITEPFPIDQGVLQGESSSPIIFNLFINSIVDDLYNSETPGVAIGSYLVHLLLFCDDIALVANSADQLQKKINTLAKSFDRLGLTVNTTKTQVIIFAKKKCKRTYSFHWKRQPIQIVNEYTYLGVTFHRNGNFKIAITSVLHKAAAAIARLLDISKRTKLPPGKIHHDLLQSLVNSVLLYSAPVWGLEHSEKLESARLRFWKKLLHLPSSTPGYNVRVETGSVHIRTQLIKSSLKFLQRLCKRDKDSLLGQCLRWQLRWEPRIKKTTWNWAKQLKNLLSITGHTDVMNLPIPQLLEILPSLITEVDKLSRINQLNTDMAKTMKSSWTPQFAKVKLTAAPEHYLQGHTPLHETRLLSQARINLFRIWNQGTSIPLKRDPCPWCNNTEGGLDHYLFDCDTLCIETSKLISKLGPCNNFVDLYNNYSHLKSFPNTFFLFWAEAFRKL
jgi:Reverse transcriptase (RNA-dependent DNA polymerase)/Endonuclease-reverse transcriptase